MNIKQETEILKGLNKSFQETENQQDIKESNWGVLDNANVLMAVPKTEEWKRILKRFANPEEVRKAPEGIPDSDYKEGRFSSEYLVEILNILKYSESITIKMSEDMPLVMETEDFKMILAPRVGEFY